MTNATVGLDTAATERTKGPYRRPPPRPKLYHTPEQKRAARREWDRRWRERHPEAYAAMVARKRLRRMKPRPPKEDRWVVAKRAQLRRNYGMSLEQYDALLVAQRGCCAVCGSPGIAPRGKRAKLNVDHDHSTGAIRGLLCHACNAALGRVDDDTNILQLMIDYLAKHSAVLRVVA